MNKLLYPTLLFVHGIVLSLGENAKPLKYLCVSLLVIYLVKRVNFFLKTKYRIINIFLGIFCFSVAISGYRASNISLPLDFFRVSFFSSILFILSVASSFFLLEYISEINKMRVFIKLLFKILFIYIIINDILLLFMMPSVSGMSSSSIRYLLGNKFETSYIHLFFTCVFIQYKFNNLTTNYKDKLYLGGIITLNILISFLVECSTTIIGSVLLLIFICFYKKYTFLFKAHCLIIMTIIFGGFFLYYEPILNIPIFQHLIVDVLKEDLTLTGRTIIYTHMMNLLDSEPFWGYGNGTASFFTTYYINENLTNTQNGLLNDFIDWGGCGVIALILLMIAVFKNSPLNKTKINPFICLAAVYIILSSIEITLGLRFLVLLSFCTNVKGINKVTI